MTSRNRKKSTGGIGFPLQTSAALMAVALLSLAYVWLDAKGQALGARINQLEQQAAEVQKMYDNELSKWQALKSPSSIEKELNQHQLVMIWPDENNIIRVPEPETVTEIVQSREKQLAQLTQISRSVIND